jgi:hypothetical protein
LARASILESSLALFEGVRLGFVATSGVAVLGMVVSASRGR